ncbi:SusC/RagA family TonB-linked outer membrane protein [Parapedobacter composti]|nr:SusC/RagA family TonB-linked outer membrane protein [Parapedobacter composti]
MKSQKYNIVPRIRLYVMLLLHIAAGAEARTVYVTAEDSIGYRMTHGRATDEFGKPVRHVLIRFADQRSFVSLTDKDGRFSIRHPVDIKHLQATHPDFLSARIDLVPDTDSLQVVLRADNSKQGEVIALPLLYESDRRYVTGAVSQVHGSELLKTPAASLSSTLAGRLPGAMVSQSSQQPYADGVSLLVRGRSTINGNAPLIVLDGVPSPLLDLSMVNTEEIDRITVLKDAAETAFYGYQGSNGVILISTKKGLNAGTEISFSANQAVQEALAKPTLLPSWEYASLRNQATRNDGISTLPFTDEQIAQFKNPDANRDVFPDNNWYDEFLKDYASLSRYNVNIRSGTERVKYYLNAGYMQQGSLLKTIEQERYDPKYALERFSVRANVDVNVLDGLDAFLYQSIVIDRRNRPTVGLGGILSSIFALPATENGPLTPDGHVIATQFQDTPPYGQINMGGYRRETITDYHGTLGLNFDMDFITKGLSAKSYLAFETKYFGTISGTKDYPRYIRDGVVQTSDGRDSVVFVPYGTNVERPLSLSRNSFFGYFLNFNGMLNYERTFANDHRIEGVVNYFAQNYTTVTTGSAQDIIPYDRISLGGKVKYAFKSKYIAQFTAGYTSSDQFAPGRRTGFFPAISAAWIASEEDFLKPSADWLSFLKLRGSFGLTGNDQLPNPRFSYLDYITSTSGGPIAGLFIGSLTRENSIANPFVRWETQRQLNLGVDVGLFNSLSIRVDVFKQSQTDISTQNNLVPAMGGIPSDVFPYLNTGLIENRGVDAEIDFTKQVSRDFRVFVTGNVLFAKNKVFDIGELNRSSSGFYYPYRSTGFSIGQHFGYLIDYSNGNGYFNSQEEIAQSGLRYDGRQPRPGDFIYRDLNNDGVIDNRDEAPIGRPSIPELAYAGTVGFEFRNVDFYLQFQGIARASRYYSGVGVMEHGARGQYFPIHREAWTPERYANGEPIAYPALSTQSSSSLRINDFFIRNSDYLRLKTAELGYTIQRVFGKQNGANMRVFVNGQNLFTFHSPIFEGIDPEAGAFTTYPIYRTFNAGLGLQF